MNYLIADKNDYFKLNKKSELVSFFQRFVFSLQMSCILETGFFPQKYFFKNFVIYLFAVKNDYFNLNKKSRLRFDFLKVRFQFGNSFSIYCRNWNISQKYIFLNFVTYLIAIKK